MKNSILIAIYLFLFTIFGIYLYGVFATNGVFLNDTYINHINVSGLNLMEAESLLEDSFGWEGISLIVDKKEVLNISAKDINFRYMENEELKSILHSFNRLKWFTYGNREKEYMIKLSAVYEEDKLRDIILNSEIFKDKQVDAAIEYSQENGLFIVKKESYKVHDIDQLFHQIKQFINEQKKQVSLDTLLLAPEILSTNQRLITAKDTANDYISRIITYDFENRKEVIDRKLIKEWIILKDGSVDFDIDKVIRYHETLSEKYNTVGNERKFKNAYGEEITINGGSYGWKIDNLNSSKKLIKAIKSGTDKTIEPIYLNKAISREQDDIGNTYIEINIEKQTVFLFVNGEKRLETPTITGNVFRGFDTPPGVFSIDYKRKNVILTGPGYASHVDYWMPFNEEIGLHDASWKKEFGGEIYKTQGSHGCINLPKEAAKEIYDAVYPGMPVIVY